MFYFISVLIASTYSLVNGFIPNKSYNWSKQALVTSGLVCLYGDIGALICTGMIVSGYL